MKGWRPALVQLRDVLAQTGRDMLTDNVPQWAAAIAYYGVLSLFPLLLAGVSLAASFVDAGWAATHAVDFLTEYVPRGGELVRATIREIIAARTPAGVLSVVFLLWSGSRVFGALIRALNIIYDAAEPYSFRERLRIELLMTLTFGVMFFLSLTSGFMLDAVRQVLRALPADQDLILRLIRHTVPPLLLLTTFFLLYRYVPRRHQDWRAPLAGAAAATFLFLLARGLFVSYVQQFARYNLVYGSLAIVVVLLVWAWVLAFLTLFGAELASHVQMMVLERQAPAEVERRHQDRAPQRQEPE